MKGIRIIELYLYKIYCNYRGCKKKKKHARESTNIYNKL